MKILLTRTNPVFLRAVRSKISQRMTKSIQDQEQENKDPVAAEVEEIATASTATTPSPPSSDEDLLAATNLPKNAGATTPVIYPAKIVISMSGCGFLCSYHIGAMICFQKHAQTLLSNVSMYCGTSAGSLIAALMVLAPHSLEAKLSQIQLLASEVPKIPYNLLNPTAFNIAQRLADLVDSHLPQDISAANGRLGISLTKQKDNSNLLVTEFPDREYLMRCLNASCYIPYYSKSTPPIIDDEVYIDGGFSNNLPMVSGMHTITISPFSGSAKIAPRKSTEGRLNFDFGGRQITFGQQQLNITVDNFVRLYQSLFPNNKALIDRYYEQGYRDLFAQTWLLRADRKSVV